MLKYFWNPTRWFVYKFIKNREKMDYDVDYYPS